MTVQVRWTVAPSVPVERLANATQELGRAFANLGATLRIEAARLALYTREVERADRRLELARHIERTCAGNRRRQERRRR